MRGPIFIPFIALLLSNFACGQTVPSVSADGIAIHNLLEQYAKAVNTEDLKLLSEIWSQSPDVSFICPLGEEHGFEAIEQHVFEKVMGGMFSARDLTMHHVAIYVNSTGNSTPHCGRTARR